MTLTSPAFTDGGAIPQKYTCEGEDISPPLLIGDIPAETDSMVLIVDDPDSPGTTWSHWVVWNIPPGQTEIEEGKPPAGAMEGTSGFGRPGYGGPCPHNEQVHHYHFKLYALSSLLSSLDPTSRQQDLEAAMSNCIIDQAELVGVYQKAAGQAPLGEQK